MYFLRQMLRNLRESLGVAMQTWVMMGIALFVLGAFACLAVQVEQVLAHWEAEAPMLIYLEKQTSKKTLQPLHKRLKTMPEVRTFRYVSPADAMIRMRASLHSHKSLLNGLDSLLFPASIEVELFAWARVQDTLRKLSAELSKVQGVQEVDYGREWFAPLWRMASWVRWILSLGGGLLLLCISLIAAGTIRLSFLLHQQEIEVMRLMGATEDFIRAPFLLEGAFSGGVSALCATFVLGFVFWGIEMQYGEPFFRFTSTSMQFLSWWQCLLLLGGAVLAGFLGSWLALRNPSKFVQVGGNNVLQEVE